MIDYGDYVEVKNDAPAEFSPGKGGWVVGITDRFASHPLRERFPSTRIMTVEIEDGSDFEVPEIFLILIDKYSENNDQ